MSQTEPVNVEIMSHEKNTEDWKYSNLTKQLYEFFEILNKEDFEGRLGTPVISLERTDYRMYGHFVIDRNAIGVKWNININEIHLDKPFWHQLMVLLHEMGHEWQQEFGTPGKYNYHNKEFRKKWNHWAFPVTVKERRLQSEIHSYRY